MVSLQSTEYEDAMDCWEAVNNVHRVKENDKVVEQGKVSD